MRNIFSFEKETMTLPYNSQQILKDFVQLHAHRLPDSDGKRVAYLGQRYHDSVAVDVPILPYTQKDIANTFDLNNPTIIWVLRQLDTYEPENTQILGLIFGGEILAHVITRVPVHSF